MKKVKDEMARRVAFVNAGDKLAEAFNSMTVLEIHHVPVVREGRLVGVLSDRDILIHAREHRGQLNVPDLPVSKVMTTKVVSVRPDTSISVAADLMLEHRVHCLPVTSDDGTLEGIITSTDLIRLLRDRMWRAEEPIGLRFEMPRLLRECATG